MFTSDDLLWYILAIMGLNFADYKLNNVAKSLRFIFMLGFASTLLYFAAINFCFVAKKRYKESISVYLLLIFSGLIWYFAYSKRKDISNVLMAVYRHRKRYSASKNTMHCVIMTLIISILIVPCFICFLNQIETKYSVKNMHCWTFGYDIHNEISKRIFILYGQLTNFMYCSGFPLYFTVCICVLFRRSSEVLLIYRISLQSQLHSISNGCGVNFAKFFQIVKILRHLNKAFTQLSFVVILYNLQVIFTVLLSFSLKEIAFAKVNHFIILLYNGACSIFAIVCFTICSSVIPENLMEIRTTVRDFISNCRYSHLTSAQNLFYLKRIESEDIIHISVCGMFQITRIFILSALGLSLTYGLLIINLNF